jgi:hypothetical protein
VQRQAEPAIIFMEDIVKKLVSLIGLVALVSVAAANILVPWQEPYLPQLNPDGSNGKQVMLDPRDPIELPSADLPDDPVYRPVGGPNDLPSVDRPGQDLDQPAPMIGPNDQPSIMPVEPMDPKGREVDGAMSEYNKGPGFWLPQPFFRDRLQIDFGPNRGRIKGELKMYDMNGRQVVRQDVFVNGRVMIGEPVASLAPGSYIVEIDCGIDPMFRGKVQKVD